MATNRALIDGSIEIDAPPSAVWKVVSDLERMGEWSPQCKRMHVFGGEVKLGARTINLNRQGWKRWPTNAKVVTFEPERAIAWKVLENRSTWSYELASNGNGGTTLTESRRAPNGISAVSRGLVAVALGGAEDFEAGLERGIAETLARIKAEVEANR